MANKPGRKRGRPNGIQQPSPELAAQHGVRVPALSPAEEGFLSPNDVGKILNVTGEAVKQWIYRRKLPAVRLANGYWKVKKTDFEAFLKARTEIGKRHVLVTPGCLHPIEVDNAFKTLGLQGVMANNFSDALLKALDHFPALFIISVSSTSKESWDFARAVRGHKSLRSFPILLLSAQKMDSEMLALAVSVGAQGALEGQDFGAETLAIEINRILRRTM